MKALILVNAYAEKVNTRQVERISDELKSRGVTVTARRNDFFPLEISGANITSRGIDCDFCVYLDKDKYVAHLLEKNGVRLFNSARAIELCDDKMTTHITLSGNGITMPETLPGLLCYDKTKSPSDETVDYVISRLSLPIVVKQSYGSLGAGVFKADTRDELKALCEKLKLEPHLFQKYIASSHGRDMRVIVIGGKAVGAIIRESNGDFRSNIGLGGTAKQAELPKDIKSAAEKAAEILGLDYCGIDFLLGETPLLCEVNSNAYFDGFESATGVNVAGLYAEHILKSI